MKRAWKVQVGEGRRLVGDPRSQEKTNPMMMAFKSPSYHPERAASENLLLSFHATRKGRNNSSNPTGQRELTKTPETTWGRI